MEGSRKLLLPPLFAALVLGGCGEAIQPAEKPNRRSRQ